MDASAKITEPSTVPSSVGVKKISSVQVAFAPSVEAQPPVTAGVAVKSPLAVMLLIAIAELVLFVSLTVLTALVLPIATAPRFRVIGETVSRAMPVPASPTTCGLPGALSKILTLPSIAPTEAGANCRLMLQVFPAATLEPQVLVCVKSPLATIVVIDSE